MSDITSVIKISQADADKIRNHLAKISQTQASTSDLGNIISSANKEFSDFFSNYGQPEFQAEELKKNSTPTSSLYNENLERVSNDLGRLYSLISTTTDSSVTSFNFANVTTAEISNLANLLSSKVMDLNILNNFNKGQMIVAGDDFTDNSKIDLSAGINTTQASLIGGANAIGLKVIDSVSVTSNNPNITVTITPLMPSTDGKVNTDPTPGNLERFYEGRFYSFIGQQDPEGGVLQLKYIVDPSDIPTNTSVSKAGFFAVVPSTEESKNVSRLKMFDGNPDTYWQCEFCYRSEPLIKDPDPQAVDLEPK